MYSESNPLVSIIIPVYNVEKYLERCILSVINQTYSNLEIILVNDGSTDNSAKLCDELAKKDVRIRVIHKENGGLSDARNVALDAIHGEWVSFIDSDDWVDEKYVDILLKSALKNNAQISVALYKNVKNSENPKKENYKEQIKVLNNKEGIKNLLYQKYYTTSACCKIYAAKLWNDIRFPKGKLYEDVITIYEIFKKADKTVFVNRHIYFYFQRNGSIVRNNFSIQKMDYIAHCQEILNDVIESYPDLKNGAISRLVWAEIHVLVQMDNYTKYEKEYFMIWDDIKKYRKTILLDAYARIKNKILLMLSFLGTKTLKIIYSLTT